MVKRKRGRREEESKKEIPLPNQEEGTMLCVVVRLLGADHLLIRCQDGVERKARIPGSLRRRMWMREGDIVLAAPWDFKPDRADVVYRYSREELRKLVEKGIVPQELLELAEELA
ncbi:translation initiation factor aIF-1A [Pyrodictium delaneyi]|uniref:Translation initiation factor 1A n=2 Tax=Pyrodictium delaneyi TaxID=1273541 RepID=A0A211YM07_9CREN|nr:translation initiation factor aIF-1A [Pyrodictium delaneyi]OWJ53857.1 translation initiation factor eIF-1A [Pyrodictium delaneyi]